MKRGQRVAAGVVPAVAMALFVGGCEMPAGSAWGGGQAAKEPPVHPIAETPPELRANPYAGNPLAAIEPGNQAEPREGNAERVAQAKAEVLSFIHRLEKMNRSTKPTDDGELPGQESVVRDTRTEGRSVQSEASLSSTSATPSFQHLIPRRHWESNQDTTRSMLEGGDPSSKEEVSPVVETATAAGEATTVPRILDVSILGGSNAEPTESMAAAARGDSIAPAVNTPLTTRGSVYDRERLGAIIEGAETEVEAAPGSVDARWRLALLRLAAGRAPGDTDLVADLPQESADLLRTAVHTVAATGRAVEDPARAAEEALDAVEALKSELQDRAALVIPTVALCSRVRAFGVFDELKEDAFTAYTPNEAIVYFEVENFSSARLEPDHYRTLLGNRLEILTPDGTTLWEHEERNIEDVARGRREDFFVAQRINLPANLSAGDYVLKVTVEDLLADKATQAVHPFRIVDPGIRAARP